MSMLHQIGGRGTYWLMGQHKKGGFTCCEGKVLQRDCIDGWMME
jgi:hypothetical protein